MKTKFNFISRFKDKVGARSVVTLFSLSKEKSFVRVLNKFVPKLLRISLSRLKISPRLRRFNKFLVLLFRVNKHHGSAYAVKWLKANHTALQRCLGSLPMSSLRELEPNLPLTRLCNGLPSFIGTMDRKAIRNNCPSTIRMWLSILSIYRVIKSPLSPKLNTITDPYRGSQEGIDKILSSVTMVISRCPSIYSGTLTVTKIIKTLKAGPNNKVSLHSIITDAIAIAKYPEIYEPMKEYCKITNSRNFGDQLDLIIYWAGNIIQTVPNFGWKVAHSVKSFDDIALGKLAFKEEAAGKLRIFAIADIWTQSLFAPLHDNLFKFLKGLPNDGTFDQDASFARALEKSISFRSCYSVDLSSATDRLPIDLQVGILDKLVGLPIGKLWKDILVDRPYMIRSNEYNLEEGYVYYKTGQPMGCLSSWAMLAVTHHFIMQYCSHRVYNTSEWCTDYEILGDDLVIFDTKLYTEYLSIMKELDVGINHSKSLVSDHLSAFEFAKRTGVDGVDVSGLSIKQLIAEDSALGRVNQAINFGLRGLIPNVPLLLEVLGTGTGSTKSAFSLPLSDKMKESLVNPCLAILGYFSNSGRISLESAVAFITDPQDEELEFLEKPRLPFMTTLQFISKCFNEPGQHPVPLSDLSDREDLVLEEVIPYMADSMIRDSLSKIQLFTGKYDKVLLEFSKELVAPLSYKLLGRIEQAQLVSIAEWALLNNDDPDDLADELYTYVYNLRSSLPPLKVAQEWSSKIDNFISRFNYEPSSKAYVDSEVPSLLREVRASGKLTVTPYWRIVG